MPVLLLKNFEKWRTLGNPTVRAISLTERAVLHNICRAAIEFQFQMVLIRR